MILVIVGSNLDWYANSNVKDFFSFFVLEVFTAKHSFEDDLVL